MVRKPYDKGMIFGIFTELNPAERYLIDYAASHCNLLYIAISSDKEVISVKKSCSVPIEERTDKVQAYCAKNNYASMLLNREETPEQAVIENPVDVYFLKQEGRLPGQKARFGKHLEKIIKEHDLKGKIEVVNVPLKKAQ